MDTKQPTQLSTTLPHGDIPIDKTQPATMAMDADERVMHSLGYKQEFKREFSLFTTFCVSFAVLGLLPSFASTMDYGIGYAGTAGMVWGWLIGMFFIQCIAFSMAELCSAMPTSGGLYYAAAVLAPKGWGPFAAWVTGWSNWIGQITGAPSVDYSLAAMILAAASIQKPEFEPTRWQTFLLTVLIIVVHSAISSLSTRWIARLNSYGSAFNMLALVTVLIAIPASTNTGPDHRGFTSSKTVWNTITNQTDYPDGVAVLMTFVAVIWTMSGYDSPFHLSEECSNASIASPRAIILTSLVGGILGWFLQLVVAYTVIDIESVMSSSLGQPWASYLLQILPRKTAMAVLALTIICSFSMGQGCMVAASRVTYAYARDDCFPPPFSKWCKSVNPLSNTPVNAVVANGILAVLMVLLILAGDVAVGALFSIGGIAQFVAFTIPIFIRVFFVGDRFRPGPWHMGRWSWFVGAAGSAFVALMVPILCLPAQTGKDLDAQGMNWTCLVYGAPMAVVLVWWVCGARRWFRGPKVNVEHAYFEGVEVDGDGDGGGETGVSDSTVPKK